MIQKDRERGDLHHAESALQGDHFNTVANPLDAFLNSAVDSLHTRRAYRRHIQEAFRIMGIEFVHALAPAHLIHYRASLLEDGRGLSTHAQALSGLRSFLLWCSDMGGLPFPARMVERMLKVPSAEVLTPYVTLTRDEAARLIQSACNLRDRALLLLMLGSGLRVSEVQNLNCSDVIEIGGAPAVWVRQGKGNKDRFVPITIQVLETLHAYLDSEGRCLDAQEALFHSQDRAVSKRESQRLSHYGIRHIIAKATGLAGINKRITPHALRHTFGMEFQRSSKDLNKTARIMGHKTIRPTLRYTDHLEMAELRENLPTWGS